MNTGALVGASIEILIYVSIGIYFLFLFFKPKSPKSITLKELPVFGRIFKYKYSFLIAGILFFLGAIINILELLDKF